MSLLANLTLAYENLVDDPIDKGIAYGKSILAVLNTSPMDAPRSVARPLLARRPERSNYLAYRSRGVQMSRPRQLVGAL